MILIGAYSLNLVKIEVNNKSTEIGMFYAIFKANERGGFQSRKLLITKFVFY